MYHFTVNKLATIIFLGLLILDSTNSQSWTERKSLPAGALARNHPVTFTLDGKGYVATGNTVNNSDVFKDVWRYDPGTNDWEELAVFPGKLVAIPTELPMKARATLVLVWPDQVISRICRIRPFDRKMDTITLMSLCWQDPSCISSSSG